MTPRDKTMQPGACMALLAALLLLLAVAAVTSGCTRTTYVPVESKALHSDTVWQLRHITDTLMMRDSVAVMQRGDTVYVTKHRDRFRYSERIDTVYRSLIDSVRVTVPYPVERKLSRWEQTKIDYGGMAICAVAVGLCAAVVWLAKKFRK